MAQPKETFRAGLVKAAIFENVAQGSKGEFTSQSVALQTSYQKDGAWQNRSLTIVKKNLAQSIQVLKQAAEAMGIEVDPSASSRKKVVDWALERVAKDRAEAEEAI